MICDCVSITPPLFLRCESREFGDMKEVPREDYAASGRGCITGPTRQHVPFARVKGSDEGQIEATVKCRDRIQWVGENCVVGGWAGERQFPVVIWGVVSGARLPGYLLCLPSLSPETPGE